MDGGGDVHSERGACDAGLVGEGGWILTWKMLCLVHPRGQECLQSEEKPALRSRPGGVNIEVGGSGEAL